MRELKIIFGLILFTTIVGCIDDKSVINTADNISFDLQLLDSTGNATTSFIQGSDIIFKVIMRNRSSNKILYYEGLKCAQMKFNVYKDNLLIGHPHPDSLGCTDDLQQSSIDPYEIKKADINWFARQENQPLPSGNYTATFKSSVSYNDPKSWLDIDLSVNFVVK